MKHYKRHSRSKVRRYSRRPLAKVNGQWVPLSHLVMFGSSKEFVRAMKPTTPPSEDKS